MTQWGVVQGCVFCGEPNESRDHLFLACPYTFTVWLAVVVDLLGVNADPNWEMTLNRLVEHNYDKLTFILLRLVFQTSIYYLWNERNDRRHTGKLKLVSSWLPLLRKLSEIGLYHLVLWETHASRTASKMVQRILAHWYRLRSIASFLWFFVHKPSFFINIDLTFYQKKRSSIQFLLDKV